MSGLIVLGDAIFDPKHIIYVKREDRHNFVISLRSSRDLLYITNDEFVTLKSLLENEQQSKKEIERLTLENKQLRKVIAAMPGAGEDFQSAKLEFEHISDVK